MRNNAPTNFLNAEEKKAVIREDRKKLRTSLYKAFLFMHVANAIKSGKFNLENSYKYRSLDNYMIDKKRWHQEKNQLLERAELKQFYAHKKIPKRLFYAGVIGLGCNIGTRKMAQISPMLKENELEHTVNWYFSLENIISANDCITKSIDQMNLLNIYRRLQDKLHTSSDGQKFETTKPSLNANYSFKYFGKKQGVSAYTFIDERNIFWHSLVFSAAERESAYVIDGLMRNEVIKSDIFPSAFQAHQNLLT